VQPDLVGLIDEEVKAKPECGSVPDALWFQRPDESL